MYHSLAMPDPIRQPSDDDIARTTDDYAAQFHDELDLAKEREEALRLERELALATNHPILSPDIPIKTTGELTGPREQEYQATMNTLSSTVGKSTGTGYNAAMVFIAYPIAGVILGWLIDRYVIQRLTGHPSFWALLICMVAGFYNGIIEMLRLTRKLEAEQKTERANRGK